MREIKCEYCNKLFKRYASQVVGRRQVCSKECSNKIRTTHIYTCELCNREFHRPVRKNQIVRFCSRKCMQSVFIRERNPFNCECLNCKKMFHKSPSAIKAGEGKFCSFVCKNIYQTGINKKGLPAEYNHYYGKPEWRKLRLEIIKRDGYKCQSCGIKPNLSKLQVHHKIRRILGGSDDPNNLITLCFSCHKKEEELI